MNNNNNNNNNIYILLLLLLLLLLLNIYKTKFKIKKKYLSNKFKCIYKVFKNSQKE